ncbi:probable beta-1,4-xylosyltransferase IRX10 [Magnolia sinica]|uniref:probable beta-1,4-xylosyltransferase IRX10 n=1 Tax=Magnolia sinica TaxID=86752 RepID=UPI00265A2296|nr:probable beta-1,4-xylosyltransferase IRX10 [Magnolia sinica]
MGSINKNRVGFPSHHHSPSIVCTRTHQIGALALVITTFFLTRLLDHHRSFTSPSFNNRYGDQPHSVDVGSGGFPWPDRGYGSHLSLKIYVYEEKEVDGLNELMRGRDGKISADSCLKGQWGTQVKIHRFLLQSRFRTLKKEDADLFFVPSYVKCVRMMGGLNDKEINQTYVKVLSQMPYFRRSGGRDHIFIFPSGAGAHLFRSWATYLNRSIILTPEGDRTDKRDTSAFNTWKDIIIPGNVDDGMTRSDGDSLQPLPLSKRKHLANFLGRAQGKVGRLQLVELAKQFPDKLESPELKFSGPDKLGRMDYFQHLRNAKFCLSPRGESSWTLRFYESFFVECVPVILSDQVELPFQNVVDYTQISIKWPSTRISSELLDYLQSIPDEEIERMIANGRQVKCLWVYAPETAPCSAMRGIMWELQRKVRRFHQSAETFWLHNGSIVNRNLIDFHDWKPPMPLP